MSEGASIRDDKNWMVFGKTPRGGHEILFRSRVGSPVVHAYALDNPMMRVRCVLRDDQVRENGMPISTKDLDDYEDRLLGKIEEANADVHLIAVVTGDGNRDLFFTARDLDDLRAAIKAAQTDIDTFKLELAPVNEKTRFLEMLSLSQEELRGATFKGVPAKRSGGLLGKLFGR
jgi:hypothetical protein